MGHLKTRAHAKLMPGESLTTIASISSKIFRRMVSEMIVLCTEQLNGEEL